MNGWDKITIKEAVDLNILAKPLDGNHGEIHPKGDDFVESGVPFIMASDIRNGKVDLENCSYISKEQALSLRKGFSVDGDVLLTHKATIGEVALLKTDLEFIMLTPQVTYYRVKDKTKLNSHFLKYYFQSSFFQKTLLQFAGGSTRDYIGITKQLDLPLVLPPIQEQSAIADIIKAFEDKIDLLEEQNSTLSNTAYTVFNENFGKYQIGDELPNEWSILPIDDLVELIIDYRGKTPKKLGFDWSDDGIPALSAKTIKKGKIVRRDAMNYGSKELYDIWMKDELQKGDILLTSEAPLGEMYYLNDNSKYILSQRLFALRVNNKITSQYLYYFLFSKYGQYLLKSRASGSTVEGIRQSELRKVEVIIPNKELLVQTSLLFQSILNKQSVNEEHILTLKNTRDSLLTELMSGKVSINGIKENQV